MSDGVVDKVANGLTGVDHEAIGELHALRAGSAKLARHHNFAALGTALHNETQDTVACTTNGKTVKKLVTKRFTLGDSGETTGLNLGGVKGDRLRGEAETVSDEAGELVLLSIMANT